MDLKETPIESSFLGFVKKAPCPSCGTPLSKSAGTSRILCSRCGEYAQFGEKALRQADPAGVEAEPSFAAPTPWTDMQAPTFSAVLHPLAALNELISTKNEGVRLLDARWPEGCCVCGQPAAREETVARRVGFSPPGGMMRSQKEATAVARGIPHCLEHKNGARFERVISFGDADATILGLFFRSYAYQIQFRKLNPWRWGV